VSNSNKEVSGIFNDLINNLNDETPINLSHDTVDSFATTMPILQAPKADVKRNSAESICFDVDRTSFVKLPITPTIQNRENSFCNCELTDEEVMMYLHSEKNTLDLSDKDVLEYLKHFHINKEH